MRWSVGCASSSQQSESAFNLQDQFSLVSLEDRLAFFRESTLRLLGIFGGSERDRLRLLEAIAVAQRHISVTLKERFAARTARGSCPRSRARYLERSREARRPGRRLIPRPSDKAPDRSCAARIDQETRVRFPEEAAHVAHAAGKPDIDLRHGEVAGFACD